jgi:hypothetical protein
MALYKQSKSLVFAQGVDTNIAPEVVPIGKLHSAQNVRFDQVGKISKKKGSTRFPITKEGNNKDSGGSSPSIGFNSCFNTHRHRTFLVGNAVLLNDTHHCFNME